MSEADKCPHCGASMIDSVDGGIVFGCDSIYGRSSGQSDLCRERTAHAETRKSLEHAKADAESWRQQAERFGAQLLEKEEELTSERTTHAETRKREDLLKSQLAQTIAQSDFWQKRCDEKDGEITCERKKWEKLREFVRWTTCGVVEQMHRLDAEAKEGK